MIDNNPIEQRLADNAVGVEVPSDEFEGDFKSDGDLESILANPNLMQQLTRSIEDGVDTLVAYHRCHFAKGQQRYALHCVVEPAFATKPGVEATPLDNDSIRIRLTDCLRYGIRAELILPQPAAQPLAVLVEVIASANSVGRPLE